MSHRQADSLFFECLRSNGELDYEAFRATCDAHPDIAPELAEIRDDFIVGQGLLNPKAVAPAEFQPTTWRKRDLSRYRMLGEIGRGGMGVVHKVWDPELRRVLALKLLRKSGSASSATLRERARLRLLEEAQVLSQLQHPAIVPVHDLGMDDTAGLYFTMPLIQGENLEQIVRRVRDPNDSWNLPRAIASLQRVCEAVAHAHSRGVLHRDLKPQNVMVGSRGETYVLDWGLAKIIGDSSDFLGLPSADPHEADSGSGVSSDRSDLARQTPSSPLVTQAGSVVGTPAYMSPEQAEGDPELTDERSDIYGLGAVLFHLLSGHAPYSESRPQHRQSLLKKVRRGPPASADRHFREAPAELAAICERAMSRLPAERYPSADAMARDLGAHLEGRVVEAHQTGAWAELRKWTQRHRAAVAGIVTALTLLVGATLAFSALWRQSEINRRAAVASQSDSLRRQNALQRLATNAPNLPTFVDTFDDGRIDRRWIALSNADRIEESGGSLNLSSVKNEGTSIGLDRYVNVIRGDFEASIRFRLDGFDSPRVARGERVATFELVSAINSESILTISRNAERRPAVCDGAEQTYRSTRSGSEVRTCVATSGSAGRMQIRREGDVVSVSYWDGKWRELQSRVYGKDPVCLRLTCVSWYAEEPFTYSIEELSVASDPETSREDLANYFDDFGDGYIDSRLVVRADSGIAAEVDGRLHLEKIDGRAGYVAIELDRTRWILSGDGEVGFGFRWLDPALPATDEGPVHLSLRMRSHDNASFGAVEIQLRSQGKRFKAFYHDFVETAPTEVSGGKLRVRREGTSIHFDYWDGSWHTLLTRPHVPKDLGMYFSFDLTAKSSKRGYVVELDDLRVSFLSER